MINDKKWWKLVKRLHQIDVTFNLNNFSNSYRKLVKENSIANRMFSYEVAAAMLVSLNKGMAAMLVSPINPLGNYWTIFLCNGFLLFWFKNMLIDHLSENPLYNTECVYITGWMSQTVNLLHFQSMVGCITEHKNLFYVRR
mgnify:CR=1 FL=1